MDTKSTVDSTDRAAHVRVVAQLAGVAGSEVGRISGRVSSADGGAGCARGGGGCAGGGCGCAGPIGQVDAAAVRRIWPEVLDAVRRRRRTAHAAEWIAYAEYLNELGEQARKQGQTLMVHNHNWKFQRVFGDRTAFDILMEYTDPRNVVLQLDLYWATNGGADPVELLERYGNRIQLFHVKDMAAGPFPGRTA